MPFIKTAPEAHQIADDQEVPPLADNLRSLWVPKRGGC